MLPTQGFSLQPGLAEGVAAALCAAVWQGTALAAAVGLCLRGLQGMSAAARAAVWMNVFALLILLHVLPAFAGSGGMGGAAGWAAAPVHASLLRLNPLWSVALAGAWALLSLWRLMQLGWSAVGLRRLARRAKPVDADAEIAALLAGRGADGKRGRAARLYTSAEVERPSVFGFLRPRVLLPEGLMERLTGEELRQVVLHEMEHVRRGDDWSNLAQKAGLALFPLNPALAWVERRLCAERELACDDRVLYASGERKTYARCLARIAEFSMIHRGVSLALGAWERRPELVRRVHRILGRPAETPAGWMARLAPAALMAGALGCALGLARSPQLVSFAPGTEGTAAAGSLPRVTMQAASLKESNLGKANLRAAAGAPARLVKAEMPVKRLAPETDSARGREGRTQRPPALLRTAVRTEQLGRNRGAQEEAWLALAEWQRAEAFRQAEALEQLIQAVDAGQSDRPSYAAVPMGNGWIIVQI
jgi:Zn-dependent protease with chaperone function